VEDNILRIIKMYIFSDLIILVFAVSPNEIIQQKQKCMHKTATYDSQTEHSTNVQD
jgi:hypothetical protein